MKINEWKLINASKWRMNENKWKWINNKWKWMKMDENEEWMKNAFFTFEQWGQE